MQQCLKQYEQKNTINMNTFQKYSLCLLVNLYLTNTIFTKDDYPLSKIYMQILNG